MQSNAPVAGNQRGVADAVIEFLEAAGIDACFGVPGGQNIPLYAAARKRGYRHILMHDERNAAIAADAYARISGKAGVCDATVGPGATNLVSGLAEAFSSSIPVLALVADIKTTREHLRHRGVASQAFEQQSIFASVAKWVGRIHTPAITHEILEHALRVACTGRPGPVVVEIPEDVFSAVLPDAAAREVTISSAHWPRYRSAPLAEDVAKAAALLKQAKRPVILAGGGSFAVQAGAEILSLAEKLGAPIVTSINGKGVVDERHPLAAGVIGVFGDVRASTILKTADVVLVLGSKFGQFNSFMWRLPEAQQSIIHVDLDGAELGRAIPSVLPIVADAREAAIHIAVAIGDAKRPVWEFKQATPPQPGTAADDPAIAPEAVMEALNAQSDEHTILVSDASLSSGWTASRYTVKGAGRKYISPRGLAGIGWAGGAAIGAAAAAPKGARIIAVAGDGAAGYWLGEMETAARFNLPISYVVLNNSGYGWVVQGERMLGITPQSTFGSVDFSSVARGLGVPAAIVEKGADLGAEIAKSLGADGPHLLDIRSSDQSSPSVDYALLDPDAASAYGAYGMG